MSEYIRRFGAPLALSAALAFGACSADQTDDGLAQDSGLSRDLELANADSFAQPQLTDIDTATAFAPTPPAAAPAPRPAPARPATPPRTTTPRTTTPAPTPRPTTTAGGNTVASGSGASESVGTIASGTTLSMRSAQRVCTNTNAVGDRFTATLAETVTGSNGASIPAGATVVLEVTGLKRSENANDPINVSFAVRSVRVDGRNFPVTGVLASQPTIERVRSSSTSDDAKKVAAGAVIGAIAGQVLGRDTKGTVIGAATGAAAGTAAAAATANYDGCLPSGAQISIRLTEAAQIRAS